MVTIFLEHRFEKTPTGEYYGKNSFGAQFWEPYCQVFGQIVVAARVKKVNVISAGFTRSDSPDVKFYDLPYYVGPVQFIFKKSQIKRQLSELEPLTSINILRVPSSGISNIYQSILRKRKRRYYIEVVADPFDVLSSGTIRSVFRKIYQWQLTKSLENLAKDSRMASYVTESALQKRYPATNAILSTWYSDVNLKKDAFVTKSRNTSSFQKESLQIVCVGTFSAILYKGQDILIKAISKLKTHKVKLVLVGDGENRDLLVRMAESLGLDNVEFVGYQTAGEGVRTYLDSADIFVLPSRQEGLPRAMIEAMARGLPCLGSNVGGIPELLPKRYLVTPNNVEELSDAIGNLLNNSEELAEMSSRNLDKAKEFRAEVMESRRLEYYRNIHIDS